MIQYGFSTLGVPGLALDTVLDLATGNGYDGVEWRCADGEPIHLALTGPERAAIAGTFRDRGITPVGLASYVRIAAPGPDEPVVDALREHIRLAADLGFGGIRMFPGGKDDPIAEADERAVRRLRAVVAEAEDASVRLLLETHDSHRAAADAARLLGLAGSPVVGALWDTMHTHLAGDIPDEAVRLLLPYLGYAQVKDMAGPEDRTPVALGAGVLPIRESLAALLATGYQGWLVWEYEAKWHPAAEPLPEQLKAGRAWLGHTVSELTG
jgi:sugar phosphate isomerase/epimerase